MIAFSGNVHYPDICSSLKHCDKIISIQQR